MKVFTLDMMFTVESSAETPITQSNLKTLIETAKDRLDNIEREGDLDAFNVVDIEDDEGTAVNYDGTSRNGILGGMKQ